MLLFSSRANQISTNVKTNQTTKRTAVMTRFLRQYSWCFADSSNQASPQEKEPTRLSTGFLRGGLIGTDRKAPRVLAQEPRHHGGPLRHLVRLYLRRDLVRTRTQQQHDVPGLSARILLFGAGFARGLRGAHRHLRTDHAQARQGIRRG